MQEARFFRKNGNGGICLLCPQGCRLKEGETGLCRVRRVKEGRLYSLNYGRVGAMALDPIEKKPLYHFYPGSWILSLGTVGCNLSCSFCQNWQLTRGESRETRPLSPDDLVRLLTREKALREQLGVAYTYAEPSVWYEYIRDCAPRVRALGQKNVLVTNGYINPKPLEDLLPWIDAMNIDIKAFREDFYRRHCGGRLEPVLETVRRAVSSCHVEITYLVIPGENDSQEEVSNLAFWLGQLSRDIPLHLSRYFPNYQMELPPTPPATLHAAQATALKYLNFVYLGNLPGDEGSHTLCPCCGFLLVQRRGYTVKDRILRGFCPGCGHEVANAFQH